MNQLSANLQTQLLAFAAHLREPESCPAPGQIETRRIAVYRELVFNNLRGLLQSNFPVISKTLRPEDWDSLVREFLAHHRCQTPLFTELGREFVDFLEERDAQADTASEFPWLAELAHYEWVELALQIADATPPPHLADGDLIGGIPVLSPLAWPLAYRWPVHTIGPASRPDVPGGTPTLLLVRRDTSGEVRFSELSPLVYRLLQLLAEARDRTGEQTLLQLSREAQAPDPQEFVEAGAGMLTRLRGEGTVLGVRLP